MLLTFVVAADLTTDLDRFFARYVEPGITDEVYLNLVDYAGIKKDPELYNKIIKQFEEFDLTSLKSTAETMAFWINVYNIGAIKMIMDNYPVESITDIGWLLQSVWNIEIINVSDKMYTLGHIEHQILRPVGDPGIHMAISCASISCPSVRREAYRADRLKDQFASQARQFLANPGKGARVDQKTSTLYLSSIFKWFKEDFKAFGGVVAYLWPNLPARIRSFVDNNRYKIKYIPYNWKLNGR